MNNNFFTPLKDYAMLYGCYWFVPTNKLAACDVYFCLGVDEVVGFVFPNARGYCKSPVKDKTILKQEYFIGKKGFINSLYSQLVNNEYLVKAIEKIFLINIHKVLLALKEWISLVLVLIYSQIRVFIASPKTHVFFKSLIRKPQRQGFFDLKIKEFAFVNGCFQIKSNAVFEVFGQRLFRSVVIKFENNSFRKVPNILENILELIFKLIFKFSYKNSIFLTEIKSREFKKDVNKSIFFKNTDLARNKIRLRLLSLICKQVKRVFEKYFLNFHFPTLGFHFIYDSVLTFTYINHYG